MLNPFFINGTNSEQGLVQDLINEQLKMYGIEVYYMPRQYISKGKIIKEVLYSKFNHAFPIEAYLVNYEGFDTNSIALSKFGIRISDEMNLIISKERFELYISELMKSIPDVPNVLRPNEGDLIYVPLSDSIMEIKYVENRKPFFQLQKNYVYDLKCELFEYEDEEISTGLVDLDDNFKDIGYGAVITVSSIGSTATAETNLVLKGLKKVNVINGGYRYSSAPNITVSSPISGVKARVVGVTTSSRGLLSSQSVEKIYIEDPGTNYNPQSPPIVSFFGGGGYNASAKPIVCSDFGIGPIVLTNPGQGYYTKPTVTIDPPQVLVDFSADRIKFDSRNFKFDNTNKIGYGSSAIAEAFLNGSGGISTIRIIDAGDGYLTAPNITISAGSSVASGNFIFGEKVLATPSNAVGIVKSWDPVTKQLKVSGMGTDFTIGDTIVGSASSAVYKVRLYETYSLVESYAENDTIEEEADNILDFTEINPFGEV